MRALTLAALAAIPAREHFLGDVLASLRPQVDVLCVYLNGYTQAPQSVHSLADHYVVDPSNPGDQTKFHWAQRHSGICLTCDDDFVYPRDYVATMVDAIEQWEGAAIVTLHGRVYPPTPKNTHSWLPGTNGLVHRGVPAGHWLNYGGTGVMAWDTRRVPMPDSWPERNMADLQVAIWAQQNGIPIWMVPHEAHWVRGLAIQDPKGIYRTSLAEGQRVQNRLLRAHGSEMGWKVLRA